MDISFQSETNYHEWNQFMTNDKILNLWGYTLSFLKQCGVKGNKKDKSFAVIENKEVIGICLLYIVEIDGVLTISNDGGFLRGPMVLSKISEKKKEKVMDFIMQTVDTIAIDYNIKKSLFFYDPQMELPNIGNILLKYDYIDASINTQLIYLKLDESEIRKNFRKSYKSLVNKGLKTYDFFVMNADNPNYDIHDLYRKTHIKAAGFEVYSKEIYDSQFEQLLKGESTLIGVKYSNEIVQLNYFNHFNGYVYYASAADDPDFSDNCKVPIGHSIMWFAIQYFKKNGFSFFELGWQNLTNQLFDIPSNKEISISYFKNGFGGELISLFRGIKYFDNEYKSKDLKNTMNQYLEKEAERLSTER